MRAGKLDRRITIETLTSTSQDEYGQPVETWVPLATVPAEVVPLRQNERFRAGRDLSAKVSRFTIRYLAGIEPSSRVVYESDVYDIDGIAEIGRRWGYEITGILRV